MIKFGYDHSNIDAIYLLLETKISKSNIKLYFDLFMTNLKLYKEDSLDSKFFFFTTSVHQIMHSINICGNLKRYIADNKEIKTIKFLEFIKQIGLHNDENLPYLINTIIEKRLQIGGKISLKLENFSINLLDERNKLSLLKITNQNIENAKILLKLILNGLMNFFN